MLFAFLLNYLIALIQLFVEFCLHSSLWLTLAGHTSKQTYFRNAALHIIYTVLVSLHPHIINTHICIISRILCSFPFFFYRYKVMSRKESIKINPCNLYTWLLSRSQRVPQTRRQHTHIYLHVFIHSFRYFLGFLIV